MPETPSLVWRTSRCTPGGRIGQGQIGGVALDDVDLVEVEHVVGRVDLDQRADQLSAIVDLRRLEKRPEHLSLSVGIDVRRAGLARLDVFAQEHRHVAQWIEIDIARNDEIARHDRQVDPQ